MNHSQQIGYHGKQRICEIPNFANAYLGKSPNFMGSLEKRILPQPSFLHDRPIIIQLTYPEFHFETETEVDSLTGLQRYKGDYKFYIGNNFQLEMRLRFSQ